MPKAKNLFYKKVGYEMAVFSFHIDGNKLLLRIHGESDVVDLFLKSEVGRLFKDYHIKMELMTFLKVFQDGPTKTEIRFGQMHLKHATLNFLFGNPLRLLICGIAMNVWLQFLHLKNVQSK